MVAFAIPIRYCPKCDRMQEETNFGGDRSKASGFKSLCKTCDQEKARAWYRRNRRRKIAYVQARVTPVDRRCACGRPTWAVQSPYCDQHSEEARYGRAWRAKIRRRNSGVKHVKSTNERGYGRRHQALRKTWQRQVDLGIVICWRCGNPIAPGSPWDLGHDDVDRTVYRGPEHQACNRSHRSRERMRFSRKW